MRIEISISQQQLQLLNENGRALKYYPVSTAKNGAGEVVDSECTPRGPHRIRAKIGHGCPLNTVFVGRRPTGEIYSPDLRSQFPQRDWILTRILWLCGNEVGINRLGNVDTMRRYIYIHGAPDDDQIGIPSSHGCIKMHNQHVIELFDLVFTGTLVEIG